MKKLFMLALLVSASALMVIGCGAGQYPQDRFLNEPVYFDSNVYKLDGNAKATLDYKVAYLKHFVGEKVFIVGHTDERDTDKYNLDLGRHRAEEAARYLVDNGIDSKRIITLTEGERQNRSSSLAENRRNEFFIVVKHQPY